MSDIVERLQRAPASWPVCHEAAAEIERLREALRPLLSAAEGLSHGTDWNNGTHAKDHGYRQKLLDAIPTAKAALSGKGE